MNHEKDLLSLAENKAVSVKGEDSKEVKHHTGVENGKDVKKIDSLQHDVIMRKDTDELASIGTRRVSFPKSDNDLVTGYLEPANPWESASAITTVSELCELYIKSCKKHKTEPLNSVLDHLKSLELSKSIRQSCLNLKNNNLTADSCEALEEVFKRVQYESIDLSECNLNDTAASALFDMVEYYEAAHELDITGNPNISTRGLQSCISMIRRSRALQIITIRGSALSEANASSLGKSLNNSFLQTIKLEHCGLTGRPIAALCNVLKKNNTLKELWLAHNDLSPEDAKRLAELLISNGYLEFLDISNNSIKDLGVSYIVKALIEQSTNIEEDSSKLNREIIYTPTGKDIKSPPIKNINSGRSMLDTLLTMNLKSPTDETEKVEDDAWDFGQNDVKNTNEKTFSTFIEHKLSDSNNMSSGSYSELAQNPLISTNNNEYSICNVNNKIGQTEKNVQTKAVDVNKNSKVDEMETSSDSAFESASEGDLRFKETPKLNNYKQIDFGTVPYTKEPILSNENLSDCGITLSESRLRSLSSDSLSSDNSLDTSDTNLLDKINEKITKNDTLTRQKHFDDPPVTFKKPKGLQALILWNNNITRESGEYISDLLATTNSLELLNIGKNILSNEFIVKIEKSLRTNSTLTNLGLQSSHLSCAGIKMLSSILQFGGNSTLLRIDIRDNNLQVEALSALVEAMKSNTSVTRIDVDDVPKRIADGANDMQFQYSRVLQMLRSLCSKNDSSQQTATITNNIKKNRQYLTSRKISLTCPSIRAPIQEPTIKIDQMSVDIKKKSNVRLRSPLPSPPMVSPSSSPVPSPSRSRFQVFRVMESKAPLTTENKTIEKDPRKFSSNSFKSRFQVTLVKSPDTTDSAIEKIENKELDRKIDVDKDQNTVKTAKDLKNCDKKEDFDKISASNSQEPSKNIEIIKITENRNTNICETREVSNASKNLENVNNLVGIKCGNDKRIDSPLSNSKDLSHELYERIPNKIEIKIDLDLEKNSNCLSKDGSDSKLKENRITLKENVDSFGDKNDQPNLCECVKKFDAFCDQSSLESNKILTKDNEANEIKNIGAIPEINVFPRNTSDKSIEIECLKNSCVDKNISLDFNACPAGIQIAVNDNDIPFIDDTVEKDKTFDSNVEFCSEKIVASIVDSVINSSYLDALEKENVTSKEYKNVPDDSKNIKNIENVAVIEHKNEVMETKRNVDENLEVKNESCKSEGEPRTRKSSWISTASCPATVDRLLSLFQNPAHLFTRTSSPDREKKLDDSDTISQSLVSLRKQSPPGGLFSWHKSVSEQKITEAKRLSSENIISSGFQTSLLDVASKQFRGIADFGKQVFRQNITFGETAISTEPPQSCESIPTEVKLEIKENISPEHTITPNSIAFLQPIQQDSKPPHLVQSDNEENSQSVHSASGHSGKLKQDASLGELMSSDITGNNL